MWRNYFLTALHNLLRNKLYAIINIVGLAMGFAAAIMIALFIRDEYSYDQFIPDNDRVFLVPVALTMPGQPKDVDFAQAVEVAGLLKVDFPSIESIGRLFPEQGVFRNNNVEANENFFWADPALLAVLKFPVVSGNASPEALAHPSSAIITRRMARKYFGAEDPVGKTLQLDGQHPLQVEAVLEDFPYNTHISADIMVSGGASFSRLRSRDEGKVDSSADDVAYTYLKLKPGADIDTLRRARAAFVDKHFSPAVAGLKTPWFDLDFVPLNRVHLYPATDGMHKLRHSVGGSRTVIYALGAIALLIVLVAAINFVNLMTARATRRAVEVGVRKTAGAAKGDLISQFLGESVAYSILGMILAVVLIAWLLPHFNAFLDRQIAFDYWTDFRLNGGMLALVLATGVLAGVYPAFVLSSFRPAVALKGKGTVGIGSGKVRYALVVVQFAILITLILATGILYRQTMFAMNDGMRLAKDQILLIKTSCTGVFPEEIKRVPGVQGAACANGKAMHHGWNGDSYARSDGTKALLNQASVDLDFFQLFGLQPISGRFFSRDHDPDPAKASNASQSSTPHPVVLNVKAVHQLGFRTPKDALGQLLTQEGASKTFEIIGVAPDYSVDPLHEPVRPFAFDLEPGKYDWLNVKLEGRHLPETLASINSLWKQVGDPKPIEQTFFDRHLQTLSEDVTRQSEIFSLFAVIAVLVASLGLFGLSAFNAERRTKEIGIRKAMGANRFDILALLVWEFTKPVLWANLIAWPVGYLVMNHWLQGFAAHMDLELWVFLVASLLAAAIALVTVSGHAFLVASAKPIGALRYE